MRGPLLRGLGLGLVLWAVLSAASGCDLIVAARAWLGVETRD